MINIYKYDGTVRAEVEPSADSYVNLQISDEHYADINFVSSAWIPFEVGDYVFLFGKYYQLLKVAAPVTKKSSVSFEYKLKFEDERHDMDDVNLMLFDNTTSDITPAYDPLHSYSKGDVVAYHTLYWECVSDTAIQGITPIEGNYWQLRSSVTHTVAEYDPTKTYTYGEEAIYNYCIFKHIGSVDTFGVHPEEGANWTQLTTAPQFDFSSVLTPRRWAQLFCDNMMRARPDQTWTVGYCIPDQPKEQAFSNVSVLSALASTADLYETEFYIEETAHRVFTINIGKKAITTSLTMKYGGDDAFSEIERNEVTDNKKVTRLVAMGGTKNILPTYRGGSKRLLLPDKMYLDSANIDPNHPLEGTHTWEDIYPSMMHATDDWDSTVAYAVGDMVVYNNTSWTCLVSNTNQTPSEGTYWQISEGTVTEFISEYKLIDKNLTFNPLDPTLIMSDGTIPKIHFITGNLAGYEFPIADFNKETKQITIQSIQDGNDSILPTAGYTFKAGDQFNVVDFYMPQSYITKAENYLAAKATEWLQRYSVDQITYKGSVNRVWSAQNQVEIVEGDLIQVVDTDFGINIQYRITQVKRYIRENYRYEIVLDNTPYVPSKIQSIINSTEKSSTYLQYSNLETQMAKTRTYKGASEAIDMAFDPESKYFTSGIAPLFVKTAMALFGTETQQYTLTGIKVSTSEGTPNIVSWGAGTITDTTQQSSARTWNIPSGSFTATDNDTSYYAYIRCNTESGSTVAEMIFTEKQYKLNEDSAYYYFLLGSLTKLTGSIRQFFTSNGFTFISGDSIVTGIIRSADGNTYFDLTNSHLHIGNSDKYIDYQNGEVKQKGIINVSQSGAESVIGVFRSAYQPNTMYYEGDTVTYGGSTWRYINTTAAQNVTPVEGDNWTNISAKGEIGTTGATGNYFEHRYAVNGSNSTPPSLGTSSVSPSGWTTSLPTQGLLEYTWMTTAEKTAAGALVGTWSTPIRVTGIKGDTGAAGSTGPSMSFSGDWSASNTYTGSSIIVQVVKYSGTYYITRSDAGGSFSSSTTPNNDTAHWNVYGSSFDNIATGLFLAQEAYIDNLIVSRLATSANPYHMLLSILDASLGIFRNKADSADISKAIIAFGKDTAESIDSGQNKPAVCVRDAQWKGDFDPNTIYYKDDRIFWSGYGTYIFIYEWNINEAPSSGHLPSDYNYWRMLSTTNLGGGSYSELSSEGIFSNGSNVHLTPSVAGDNNGTAAYYLKKRNGDNLGMSTAVFGKDDTSDSDTVNASKSFGGWFNRLFIESELDNIFVTSDSTNMTLDKSSYHTIHYYGSSDKNVYLPAVNGRDVGLKFWFREINTGNMFIGADRGHSIINQNGDSVVRLGVEHNSLCMVIWDGSYWIFNFMN